MKNLVFVCVSNTCRSPLAEYICRLKLKQKGLEEEFHVKSRSLSTDFEPEGSPASEQGVIVMRNKYDIDMTRHRSTLLTQGDINEAYAIIPVKRDLGVYISECFDVAGIERITYFDRDIPDPWHQPVEVFEKCAANIDHMLDNLLDRILIKK